MNIEFYPRFGITSPFFDSFITITLSFSEFKSKTLPVNFRGSSSGLIINSPLFKALINNLNNFNLDLVFLPYFLPTELFQRSIFFEFELYEVELPRPGAHSFITPKTLARTSPYSCVKHHSRKNALRHLHRYLKTQCQPQ